MRNLIMGAIGAAAIAIAGPAAAQVHVHTDAPGVGVRIGSGDHYRGYRGYHRGYRAYGSGNCRQITSRTVRPNGTVVVRRSTRC
jgi:hypothetical protein